MNTKTHEFVSSYLTWLKENITAKDLDGVWEITTPFLDRHNDHLQIFVQTTDNGFRLTDDGYIISDLQTSGCGINTEGRRKMMTEILNGHGVSEKDGELFVEATQSSFPHKKHALIQAMLNVNDMFVVAAPRTWNFFLEDIQKFFDQYDIRYTPRVAFVGRSTYTHNFDFVIPKSKTNPERLIRAINSPTKQHAEQLLFSWTDTKDSRPPDTKLLAMLNDRDEIKSDLVNALRHYDITPILWSKRVNHVHDLAA